MKSSVAFLLLLFGASAFAGQPQGWGDTRRPISNWRPQSHGTVPAGYRLPNQAAREKAAQPVDNITVSTQLAAQRAQQAAAYQAWRNQQIVLAQAESASNDAIRQRENERLERNRERVDAVFASIMTNRTPASVRYIGDCDYYYQITTYTIETRPIYSSSGISHYETTIR